MSDLIERQAAIDELAIGAELLKRVLDDVDVVGYKREKYKWGLDLIESYILDMKELPSAQPERMVAKWIVTTSLQEGQITWRDYKCSNCSHHRGKPMNFCEVCGAKMER